MSERSPEQVLMDEYNRIMRSGATLSTSTPSALASALPRTYSTAATTQLTGRQANQGYTLPVPEATQTAPAGSGGSALGTIGSTALKIFTGGLGIVPLISGLSRLFSGGGSPAPPPLVPYAMPGSIGIQAANSSAGGSFQLADQSQSGAARAYTTLGQAPQWPAATTAQQSAAPAAAQGITPSVPATPPGTPPSASAAAPQIVVNVSAMDSQSFLDRSTDIAQAVRQAMLSMNSLNDVVSEL